MGVAAVVHVFGNPLGPPSSTSQLLHGMRLPGARHPGERSIRSVHKGEGDERTIVLYGGRQIRTTKQKLYQLARDRGWDLSHQRFQVAHPEDKAKMLKGSLEWQGRAKARWLGRLDSKIKASGPEKKKRLKEQRARLAVAPVRSPHLGHRPVSSYLRRWWP